MNSTNGYASEPKMIKCDGCGRFFPALEMRRCKACGGLFCPDCRSVHDCRTSHVEPQIPVVEHAPVAPVVIRGLDGNHEQAIWNNETPAQTPVSEGRHTYGGIHFLDDEKDSIGSAALGSMPFGRQATDVASDHLVPLEDTTLTKPKDGYYRIQVPDDSRSSQYRSQPPQYQPQPQYQQPPQYQPQPQYQQSTQYQPQPQYQQPLQYQPHPQYQQSPQYQPQPQYQQPPQYQPQPQYQQPPQYQPQPQYQQPPQYAYAKSVPVPGLDEAVCDECGQIYKKLEMRKCKKCGAVLCPKCRARHKCKKASKKEKQGELYPQSSSVHEDSSRSTVVNSRRPKKQPRVKKQGKKMSKKTLIIIIAAAVLVAGLIVAFLMIKAQDPSDLPPFLADLLTKIFPNE